jgi:hypothetical protein
MTLLLLIIGRTDSLESVLAYMSFSFLGLAPAAGISPRGRRTGFFYFDVHIIAGDVGKLTGLKGCL